METSTIPIRIANMTSNNFMTVDLTLFFILKVQLSKKFYLLFLDDDRLQIQYLKTYEPFQSLLQL